MDVQQTGYRIWVREDLKSGMGNLGHSPEKHTTTSNWTRFWILTSEVRPEFPVVPVKKFVQKVCGVVDHLQSSDFLPFFQLCHWLFPAQAASQAQAGKTTEKIHEEVSWNDLWQRKENSSQSVAALQINAAFCNLSHNLPKLFVSPWIFLSFFTQKRSNHNTWLMITTWSYNETHILDDLQSKKTSAHNLFPCLQTASLLSTPVVKR